MARSFIDMQRSGTISAGAKQAILKQTRPGVPLEMAPFNSKGTRDQGGTRDKGTPNTTNDGKKGGGVINRRATQKLGTPATAGGGPSTNTGRSSMGSGTPNSRSKSTMGGRVGGGAVQPKASQINSYPAKQGSKWPAQGGITGKGTRNGVIPNENTRSKGTPRFTGGSRTSNLYGGMGPSGNTRGPEGG